jgi:hypothetical protein
MTIFRDNMSSGRIPVLSRSVAGQMRAGHCRFPMRRLWLRIAESRFHSTPRHQGDTRRYEPEHSRALGASWSWFALAGSQHLQAATEGIRYEL